LHLLSVKPVQILQASSRAKRQLSTINYNYQLPWSARRKATTYRAEVYASPVEAKTHRAETDIPCAITFFL